MLGQIGGRLNRAIVAHGCEARACSIAGDDPVG
jgi:hypothetical protein